MKRIHHIIKKQVIDLQIDKRLDAFHIQNDLSMHYYKRILPGLERVFDMNSDEETCLVIDKLEIDLGIISVKEIENDEWTLKCLGLVEEKLSDLRLSKSKPEPMALNTYRQWNYYMQYGFLPWNTQKVDERWLKLVLEALAVNYDYTKELCRLILMHPFVLTRILSQHSESFIIKLVIILTASKQDNLSSIIFEFKRFVKKAGKTLQGNNLHKLSAKDIWKSILIAVASGEKHISFEVILKYLPRIKISVIEERNLIIDGLKSVFHEKLPNSKINLDENGTPLKGDEVEWEELKDLKEEPVVADEGIFVQYAGIVLLHPFLPQFFERIKLAGRDSFTDLVQKQKALYYLHFMSTGKKHAEEFELIIPKILVGYPLAEPVGKDIKLTDESKKECINLLNAVISQWEVLKNTSIEGLREGFLQRNGKIYRTNEKLFLQLETDSIDVLLDRLPWNLSMVKLPWMEEILRVEWR